MTLWDYFYSASVIATAFAVFGFLICEWFGWTVTV